MPLHVSVLASGSRGNATLVKAGSAGVLIDFGIGPRSLETRLDSVGASWNDIHAVVLTHTHGDHVDASTFGRLRARGVPLYCHPGHLRALANLDGFAEAADQGLIRTFDDRPFLTPDGLRVEPIELSHDAGPTYGFRLEGRPERGARPVTVGYVADTGTWTRSTADLLSEVDVLGVEFNHDVEMTRNSGRSARLIARNLGHRGHLSNDQGARLIEAVLQNSGAAGPSHVVLLHLSSDCNRPDLALKSARSATRLTGRRISVHAAEQGVASPSLVVPARRRRSKPARETLDLPF